MTKDLAKLYGGSYKNIKYMKKGLLKTYPQCTKLFKGGYPLTIAEMIILSEEEKERKVKRKLKLNKTETTEKRPNLKFNLYQQTFCSTCNGVIKVGEFVIEVSEEKKMCTKCGERITEDWFKERKGKSHG